MKFCLLLLFLVILSAVVTLADPMAQGESWKSCAKGICEQCGVRKCCRSKYVCGERYGEGYHCVFNQPGDKCNEDSGGRCGVCIT